MALAEKLRIELPSAEAKAKILLVDDRLENRRALEAVLEPLDQELVHAASGDEALREILQHDFAAILMDVQMPGIDGLETTKLIKTRERSRLIPIIFITAKDEDGQGILEGYSVGAVDFIKKPFQPDILRSKVAVFVDLYLKEQQIKRQATLIQQALIREAERKRIQTERELEQRHLMQLNIELEKRVQERTKELVEANKEMELFCYSVAHDLRAPIRNIIAMSKMLLMDASEKLTEDECERLRQQGSAGQRMATLIDDLLRLYRLGRKDLHLTEVDLSQLVKRAAKECGRHYSNSKCTFDITPGLKATCDAGLVEVLIQNLCDNAIKYSPNGGTIRFGSIFYDGATTYFMKDEGIGFEMEFESKLFKPFERLVSITDFPGTGIGLAMVEKIVARHGGRAWAESEPGKGATFYFTLGKPI